MVTSALHRHRQAFFQKTKNQRELFKSKAASGMTKNQEVDRPTEPGWFWCHNPIDNSLFVCHVFDSQDGLACSWMISPGESNCLHESDWIEEVRWWKVEPPFIETRILNGQSTRVEK